MDGAGCPLDGTRRVRYAGATAADTGAVATPTTYYGLICMIYLISCRTAGLPLAVREIHDSRLLLQHSAWPHRRSSYEREGHVLAVQVDHVGEVLVLQRLARCHPPVGLELEHHGQQIQPCTDEHVKGISTDDIITFWSQCHCRQSGPCVRSSWTYPVIRSLYLVCASLKQTYAVATSGSEA